MKLNQWFSMSFAAMALAACGGGGGNSNPTPQNNKPASAPVAASTSTSATSTPAPNNGKVLRIGSNAEFAPFEFMDEKQEIHGFDIDLLKEMAKAGGFSVEFKHTPWDGIFAALQNGDIDVIASAVTITEERKKNMLFTDPYYKITQMVLVPPNKTVKNTEDLKNLNKIGVVNGQTGDIAAKRIFGDQSPKIARFETVTLLIKEVESGGVDAAITDSAMVTHYLKNNTGKGFSMAKIDDFQEENYGFVARLQDQETINMLNSALKTVRENGRYAEVEKKYFAQ